MSFFSKILPMVQTAMNSNDLRRISTDLSGAMKNGLSPQHQDVQELARELLRRVGVKGDVRSAIDRLDALIPDSFERKFGITPQMKLFVKQALGSSASRIA